MSARLSGAQIAHQLEQDFGLAMRQRAGRFVERDHPRVAHQRLADFDHLPLGDRQLPQLRVGSRSTPIARAAPHERLASRLLTQPKRGNRPSSRFSVTVSSGTYCSS